MRNFLLLAVASCVLAAGSTCATAPTLSSEGATPTESTFRSESGVPIERIIAGVAKRTGKKFVLDPRVHASVVLVGQDPSEVTYAQLLTVLEVYGYAAVDDAGYVHIIPDAAIRHQAIPTVTSKDTRPASEYVTEVIPLKYISAAQLVPLLRPMIPQQGHLVALPSANALILVDRFANVRRIDAIAKSLDTPENKPGDVEAKKEP
jgi:general secretion pathway protein D